MPEKDYFEEEPQNITIEDVAQAAGVSVSTVSRILNGKPDVAASTRKRVLRVIQELGYIPHVSAQNLAAKRSRIIGLLFPMEYAGLTQLELDFFTGAASEVEAHNYFLNLLTSPVDEARLLSLYKSGQVDGVILMQVVLDDWRARLLRERGYPFVMIGRCAENTGLGFVDLDFEGAIDLAFDHLYPQGHRHIGFIARPVLMRELGLGVAVRFLRGYLNACERYGMLPLYREPDLNPEAIDRAASSLLRQHPEISAVIVSHGAASVPMIRAAQTAGRDVPKNFSVVAVTTNRVANLVTPPLTTINFPTDRMGHLAAEMLLRLLQNPEQSPEQIVLPPELIIRESTGRA
jgi:DNA-binding LacI/PurR family transcriptional regulator